MNPFLRQMLSAFGILVLLGFCSVQLVLLSEHLSQDAYHLTTPAILTTGTVPLACTRSSCEGPLLQVKTPKSVFYRSTPILVDGSVIEDKPNTFYTRQGACWGRVHISFLAHEDKRVLDYGEVQVSKFINGHVVAVRGSIYQPAGDPRRKDVVTSVLDSQAGCKALGGAKQQAMLQNMANGLLETVSLRAYS